MLWYQRLKFLVSKVEIPKSIDYELYDFLDNVGKLSEQEKMNRMIAIMEKMCSSTKSAFVIDDTIELLKSCIRYFENHFLYYVIDSAIKVLEMNELQNCMMKRQNGENASVLRRWYLIPNVNPKMKDRYKIEDWMFNQRISIQDIFDIPTTEQYIYLELLFICDQKDELKRFMKENVLNDLALAVIRKMN